MICLFINILYLRINYLHRPLTTYTYIIMKQEKTLNQLLDAFLSLEISFLFPSLICLISIHATQSLKSSALQLHLQFRTFMICVYYNHLFKAIQSNSLQILMISVITFTSLVSHNHIQPSVYLPLNFVFLSNC